MPTSSSTPVSSGAVTIRGLAPELKARLRVRAAHNARSMEAEARAILEAALAASEEDPTDLATFARALFAPFGGAELELPKREPAREPPDFGMSTAEVDLPPAGAVAPKPAKPKGGVRAGRAPSAAGRRRR